MISRRLIVICLLTGSVVAGIVVVSNQRQNLVDFVRGRLLRRYTVEDRLETFSPVVEHRLRPLFAAQEIEFPPVELAYLIFKDSRRLECYARTAIDQPWKLATSYPILKLSGTLGPKLAEGDRQVPEGLYRVEFLNPNSQFHLSLRLNYPNAFDVRMGRSDGRNNLGSDIMIHGGNASIGCIAVGDQTAEDLFVLTALASKERVRVVISPTDFRRSSTTSLKTQPDWVADLYADLAAELKQFPSETE
jgi:hypothetical protein